MNNLFGNNPLGIIIKFLIIPIFVILTIVSFYFALSKDKTNNNSSIDVNSLNTLKLYCYYMDSCPSEGGDSPQTEEYTIKFSNKRVGNHTPFKADVIAGEDNCSNVNQRRKEWEITGYYSEDYLVISYSSKEVYNSGIGNIILRKKRDIWIGYYIGEETNEGDKIIQCPYIASPKKLEDDDEIFTDLKKLTCTSLILDWRILTPDKKEEDTLNK